MFLVNYYIEPVIFLTSCGKTMISEHCEFSKILQTAMTGIWTPDQSSTSTDLYQYSANWATESELVTF